MIVLYFAQLKEITGIPNEIFKFSKLQDLLSHLYTKYPKLKLNNCLLSLNCNIIPFSYDGEISEQDELVFIPPVSGG